MIGKETPPSVGQNTQFKPGQVANPNGRPKGSLNWSNIVKELLADENLAGKLLKTKPSYWNSLKRKDGANLIVMAMMAKAISGDKQAADWLRKTGFGDQLDINVNKSEAARASVEELAAQDDDVSKWATNQLAEAPARPDVASDAPIQDQGQGRDDSNLPPQPDSAEISSPEGGSSVQPDSQG